MSKVGVHNGNRPCNQSKSNTPCIHKKPMVFHKTFVKRGPPARPKKTIAAIARANRPPCAHVARKTAHTVIDALLRSRKLEQPRGCLTFYSGDFPRALFVLVLFGKSKVPGPPGLTNGTPSQDRPVRGRLLLYLCKIWVCTPESFGMKLARTTTACQERSLKCLCGACAKKKRNGETVL